jgi:hypothetical protein
MALTTTYHPVPGAPNSAPIGAGVKAKPATRVDLRSSPDSDPSSAYVRTQAGNAQIGHNQSTSVALTGPAPSGMTKTFVAGNGPESATKVLVNRVN